MVARPMKCLLALSDSGLINVRPSSVLNYVCSIQINPTASGALLEWSQSLIRTEISGCSTWGATTVVYGSTVSVVALASSGVLLTGDRKSTRLNSSHGY